MNRRTVILMTAGLLLQVAPAAEPATPPERVSYQGVLRDAAGAPRDGSFAMEFRFYDVAAGGSEILINTPPPVTVSGGLFDVALGSGGVVDGAGPGTYLSLTEMFADFGEVYMEILVDGEVLSPRVRIAAEPYALNAARLDGKPASGFLDTSAASQTKAGDLGVLNLGVAGQITISGGGPGAGRVLTSDASGQATWMDLPFGPEQALLRDLAGRLHTPDPQALPLASLGGFDCTGGSTATMTFTIDGAATGSVAGFVGRGRISSTYEYLVLLESGAALSPAAQIGRLGRLTVAHATGGTTFTGRITGFGLTAMTGATRTYVVRLEPRVSQMRRSRGYGIRQQSTLPNIISAEFGDAGLPNYALSIAGGFSPLEMAIRFDESSLDFLTRLGEDQGIHYHFEELPAEERMVWADHNGAFPIIAGTFPYHGDMEDPGTGEEFVSTFHARERQYTASALVTAYDLTSPSLLTEALFAPGGGTGQIHEFFSGGVDAADAGRRAQTLAGRDQVRRLEHSGTGNVTELKAGHRFTLDDNTAAGFGGTYLVTEVTHFATADPDPACIGYGNVFTAIPDTVTYRPPRVTPKPVVKGPMTALVTGPAGQETYSDAYGRVKVRFYWDRVSPANENSSAWIRVAAPAGRTDDRRYVPRIGTEVVVDFLQGDPDRPVIVGSVYNAADLPPAGDVLILDGGEIRMDRDSDGDQTIYFRDAGNPTDEYLRWSDLADRFDVSNDLAVSGDLTVSGNDIFFGGGGRLLGTTSVTLEALGNADTDDIYLLPGNSFDDGAVSILGDGAIELRAGDGQVSFVNGATGVESARLDAGGNLQIDGDLTVSGGDATLGFGSLLSAGSTGLTVAAGDADTDFLAMRAGNSADDGEIFLAGNGTVTLRSGNGLFNLVDADFPTFNMTINQSSDTLNAWTLGGANLDLFLGDSGADDVLVPGTLSVTGTKNFVQNHPERPDLSVVFTALEGDEAGTYTRGSARLDGGVARIRLSRTFAWVTNPDVGLTAHVTPRGEATDVYVESVSSKELVVRARAGADPEGTFDYVVYGLRIGYEEFSVLQPRRMDGALPSLESVERFYADHADLRSYNALERFRRPDSREHVPEGPSPAARALRAAIGERDSDVAETPGPNSAGHEPDPFGASSAGNRIAETAAGDEPGPGQVETEDGARKGAALDERGDSYARSFRTVDPELANVFPVTGDVELGDLVVVDRDEPSAVRRTTRRADPAVLGVVAGRPGLLLGGAGDVAGSTRALAPVAVSGITVLNVDAGYGRIEVGDLLTSSPTAGHAMRADEPLPGTIIGKALQPLDAGTGRIRVLVMPR